MFQITNNTPFRAELLLLPDLDGVDTIFTIVKGTFAIDKSLAIADEQLPVVVADEYFAEPDKSSIRAPSDVSLLKTATDVLVLGSAWAPRGQRVWQLNVSLSVGSLSKSLRVSGDRVWEAGVAGGVMKWVAPFERMPLVWERAFGGTVETKNGPASSRRNPVGMGYRPSGTTAPLSGQPVPNIEDPAGLISAPEDMAAPAGFAPIAPHWEPRASYAGTYDQAWQERRAPFLPDDFDRRFFQLAPPGMIASGHLEPGEWVNATGLNPDGDLRFQLPNVRIGTTYVLDGAPEPMLAKIETIILAPDENRLVLVWRSALRCDKKARRVNEVEVKALQ